MGAMLLHHYSTSITSIDLYHKFNGFGMNLVFSALHLFLNSFILKYLEETEYVMKSLRLEFEG